MDAETTAHVLLHCNIYTTEGNKMLQEIRVEEIEVA